MSSATIVATGSFSEPIAEMENNEMTHEELTAKLLLLEDTFLELVRNGGTEEEKAIIRKGIARTREAL